MATWLISRRAGILSGSKDYILLNKTSAVSQKEQNFRTGRIPEYLGNAVVISIYVTHFDGKYHLSQGFLYQTLGQMLDLHYLYC